MMKLPIAIFTLALSAACLPPPPECPTSSVAPAVCVPSPAVNVEAVLADYAYERAHGIGLTLSQDASGEMKLDSMKFQNGTDLPDGVWYGEGFESAGDTIVKVYGVAAAPPANPAWACELRLEVDGNAVIVRCMRVQTCTPGCMASRQDYPGGASWKCWCSE